ncbi:hypothetical protein WK36_07970 [Burkholderia cepacia]|nr:hypothetical protein WK36_07970 [Burkholderia cepacia]
MTDLGTSDFSETAQRVAGDVESVLVCRRERRRAQSGADNFEWGLRLLGTSDSLAHDAASCR